MNETLGRIAADYRAGLGAYLADGGEPALGRAYELGRTALKDEINLLELLAIHHEALASLVAQPGSRRDALHQLNAARDFVTEAISPFEMTHRGFREANQALHRINERLESEARRIAHVIHDDAGALLVTVHLAFKELERELSPEAKQQLRRVRAQLNELEQHLRHLSHELRPTILDDLGLLPALCFLAQGISARNGLRVEVHSEELRPLSPTVQTVLYRIVQEALANVVRHSRATHATVSLRADGPAVLCSIRDDGVGIRNGSGTHPERTHGLGLLGIRDRLDALGGTLQIHSDPGQGTELRISVPGVS